MKLFAIAAFVLASAATAIAQTSTTPSPGTTTPGTTSPGVTTTPGAATRSPTTATTPSSTTTQSGASLTLTDEQATNWVNKTIYSSDNSNIGEVVAFARDSSGKIIEMHADIGGFLGMGETRVRVMPQQFRLEGDRVIMSMTAEQAKTLPKVAK